MTGSHLGHFEARRVVALIAAGLVMTGCGASEPKATIANDMRGLALTRYDDQGHHELNFCIVSSVGSRVVRDDYATRPECHSDDWPMWKEGGTRWWPARP